MAMARSKLDEHRLKDLDVEDVKAEAERLLSEQFADLPVVVARPSIVVGHTELGCKPSGSIFWVLRAVEALRFITWDLENRIDVVPVDWAADALTHLLFAPRLKHNRYHVSADPNVADGASGARSAAPSCRR